MPEWLDLLQIFWFLAACFFCFLSGKTVGMRNTINVLLDTETITLRDLEKLEKKLQENDVD